MNERAHAAVVAEEATILIVDGRPASLSDLQSILLPLGQKIVLARSGAEALRRLLERDYAVVLIDMNMRGTDGFETARFIRGSSRTAHTPVIFLTERSDGAQSARGYALGAADCIVTPATHNPHVSHAAHG